MQHQTLSSIQTASVLYHYIQPQILNMVLSEHENEEVCKNFRLLGYDCPDVLQAIALKWHDPISQVLPHQVYQAVHQPEQSMQHHCCCSVEWLTLSCAPPKCHTPFTGSPATLSPAGEKRPVRMTADDILSLTLRAC